ncbi:hypothetical protein AAHH67_09985 [Niallia circulans]
MTRPMHRLHLFTRDKATLLLDKAHKAYFTVEKENERKSGEYE